jgi:hypothetical protein
MPHGKVGMRGWIERILPPWQNANDIPLPCFSCLPLSGLSPTPNGEPSLLAQHSLSWLDGADRCQGRARREEHRSRQSRSFGQQQCDIPPPTQERLSSAFPGGAKLLRGSTTILAGRHGLPFRGFVGLAAPSGLPVLLRCVFCGLVL